MPEALEKFATRLIVFDFRIRKDRKVDFNRCFSRDEMEGRKLFFYFFFKGETYKGSNKIFRLFFFFFFVRLEFLVATFLLHVLVSNYS